MCVCVCVCVCVNCFLISFIILYSEGTEYCARNTEYLLVLFIHSFHVSSEDYIFS